MQNHEANLTTIRKTGYAFLIIWPAFLFGSFMGFDAPNSERALLPWIFVGIVLLMPVLVVCAPRFAKEALFNNRIYLAYAIAFLPLIPFLFPFFIWALLLVSPR